jgi:hypothetical protein
MIARRYLDAFSGEDVLVELEDGLLDVFIAASEPCKHNC